ncbi:hypothetical protein DVH24_033852 [Malus domestica]|uniref:Cytochrome P450 n=1 Tax=Malus domestica TaxID=3750 RepID=A0A498KVI7_MALDO|nr:hypothetical protein DVH24_033852 [Malus domestica]
MFAFLLFIIMVLKIGKRGNTNNYASNLPPGPWKLPFIGNLHQLIGCLPHHGLRDLAEKYGHLMHLLGEVSTIIHDVIFASRPQILAARILSYGSTNIAFAPYGDYWRQLRKICTLELLSTKRVQSYRPVREEEVLKLIKSIALRSGSAINLTREIYSLTYSITSRAAFAGKVAGGFALADLYPSVSLLHLVSGIRPKLERLRKQADRIIENIINEHQKDLETTKNVEGETVEDLVHVLLKFHEHGGELEFSLTTNNIKDIMLRVHFLFVSMISCFNKSNQFSISYLNAVIKETLRLHPSVPLLLPRECGEKCEIGGYDIPVKSKVIVNAWAIGRDPKYWTEPERFKPGRFHYSSIDYKGTNFEYIPFGAGRRICPGILYGLANIELPLALLLYHFDWKLPDGTKHEDLDMTETFGTRGLHSQSCLPSCSL